MLAKLGFRPTGEVCQVFSHGRGEEAAAALYSAVLAAPGDCDDDNDPMEGLLAA